MCCSSKEKKKSKMDKKRVNKITVIRNILLRDLKAIFESWSRSIDRGVDNQDRSLAFLSGYPGKVRWGLQSEKLGRIQDKDREIAESWAYYPKANPRLGDASFSEGKRDEPAQIHRKITVAEALIWVTVESRWVGSKRSRAWSLGLSLSGWQFHAHIVALRGAREAPTSTRVFLDEWRSPKSWMWSLPSAESRGRTLERKEWYRRGIEQVHWWASMQDSLSSGPPDLKMHWCFLGQESSERLRHECFDELTSLAGWPSMGDKSVPNGIIPALCRRRVRAI